MAEKIVVINGSHAGYRRAGFALAYGRNELDAASVSAPQLAMLQADPRLSVLVEPAAEIDAAPGQLGQGSVPGDLTPAEPESANEQEPTAETADEPAPKAGTAAKKK